MATPIKETPILYGEDSDRFLKEVRENENKKISDEEYKESIDLYKKVMKNNTFDGIIL
ncbi:MAG: hypothetical protein ACUZ8H_13680 [Candidatus Anammoxibacter sp.]